jgi:hypothetical protein
MRIRRGEDPRLDAFDEEFGREPVARTGARFWIVFSIALGAVSRFWGSAADGRLRLELNSAVMAPVSARTYEGLNEEIDRLRRQVEALKNEITKLKDAEEQLAQMITAEGGRAGNPRSGIIRVLVLGPDCDAL